jgi:hypothetical protein
VISVAPNVTLARTKASIDLAELSAITARRRRARTGVEILRTLAPRRGPAGAAIDHLDRAGDQDFAGGAGLEERVAGAERKLRLVHLDNPFEKIAVGIDHRAPKLLRQKPGRLVGTPSWSSNCRADMPLECVAITCAAQNQLVSGNFDRCQR